MCVYIFDLYYLYLRPTVSVCALTESNAISILCMYVRYGRIDKKADLDFDMLFVLGQIIIK